MSKDIYKNNSQKDTSKLLESAAEQWVNLILAQIVYKKPSYGLIKSNKNQNNYGK